MKFVSPWVAYLSASGNLKPTGRLGCGARVILQELYGTEIDSIRESQKNVLNRAFGASDTVAVAAALSIPRPAKPTRSHGA
jgi:hypothetical protein